MKQLSRKLLSLIACMVLLCTMISPALGGLSVAAEETLPVRPEGNKNYADDITGVVRKGPYWADDYYTFSKEPLSLELYVGTDALFFSGASFPADYVIEADVTMPASAVNVPDYRFTIGDPASYVRVMTYDAASHIYGASDSDYRVGGVDYKVVRTPGETLHYVFKKQGTKLSVWVDGKIIFDNVEVGAIGGGFGLHLNAASWVGGDDHTVGVKMENIDIYSLADEAIPERPQGNKNYANDINGATRVGPYWADDYYTLSFNPLKLQSYVGTDALHLTGAAIPSDFVVEADVTMPAGVVNTPDYRFSIGDSAAYVRVMVSDASVHIYGESDSEYFTGTKTTVAARTPGSTQHYMFRKEGTKLSVWVDDTPILMEAEIGTIGSGFGLHLTGSWVGGDDHTVGVTMENVDIYGLGQEENMPSMPAGNKNYADDINGAQRVGPYWDDSYYALSTNPLKLQLNVGSDVLHLTGAAIPSDFVVEADVTMPAGVVNKPDYRFTIGDANNYVRIMFYDVAGHIYGKSDSEHITGGVAHKVERPAGETQRYVFKKEGTKLTIWVDGELKFNQVEVGNIGSGFGLHLNGGWVGGDDHTVGVTMDDVKIYSLSEEDNLPSMPVGNKNYADYITGAERVGPYWADDYYTLSTNPLKLQSYVGTDVLHLTGAAIPTDYVVEADVTIPEGVVNVPDYRFTIGNSVNYVRVMTYDAASHIYGKSDSDYIVGGTGYKVVRPVGEAVHYVFKKEGTKLSMWANGDLIFNKVEVGNIGSGFGLHLTGGWVGGDDHTIGVTMENVKIYTLGVDLATPDLPTHPEGNKNYANDITGAQRVGPYWADDYYTLSTNPLSLKLFVGTDALHLTGATIPSNYVVEVDVTMPEGVVNLPDYRFTIGDAANYVRVMTYDAASHIYGESDSEYITGGVAHKAERPLGKAVHYVFKKEGTKLTVWADGNMIFENVEIGNVGSGFGLHLCGGWVGGDDHTIGVKMENIDIYTLDEDLVIPELPTRPEGNRNYANEYNSLNLGAYWDPASYFSVSYNPLVFSPRVGTDHMTFSGIALPKNFVVEMDITTPVNAVTNPEYRIVIGTKANSLQFLLDANGNTAIYKGYEAGAGFLSGSPIASGTEASARVKGTAQHVVICKQDGKLSVWVDDALLYFNVDASDIVSGFGFYIQDMWVGGDDHTLGVTLNNVDIYDTAKDEYPESTYEQDGFYMGAGISFPAMYENGSRFAEMAALLKEANINLVIPWLDDAYEENPAALYAAFQAAGIDMIASPESIYDNANLNADQIMADVQALRAAYSRIVGFNVWDEPHPMEYGYVRQICDAIARADADALSFSSLFPSYGNYTWENGTYDDYVDGFLSKVQPSVLVQDFYPFQTFGLDTDMTTNDYWKDLAYLTKRAQETGIPYWQWVSGLDEWNLGTSDEMTMEHMKLQINGALAYGVEGILIFNANQCIITNEIEKAAKFDGMKQLNKESINIGNLLFDADRTAIYHSKGYDNAAAAYLDDLSTSGVVSSVNSLFNSHGIIVSLFDKGGDTYMVLVNKDYENSQYGSVKLKNSYKISQYDASANTFGTASSSSTVSFNLPAAGIQVYKLDNSCEHAWADATCTSPKTCALCGATEGTTVDHVYENGACKWCGILDPDATGTLVSTQKYNNRLTFEVYEMADGSHKLVVSGTGVMPTNKQAASMNFLGYKDTVKSVVIEEGVTTVGYGIFNGWTALSSVSLPSTLTTIDGESFRGCTALKAIDIPDSVTTLGYGAFWGAGLESVVVPASVTSIKNYVFYRCKSLVSAEIYGTTEYKVGARIYYAPGARMFSECSKLSNIVLGEKINLLNTYCFHGAALTEFTVPARVKFIYDAAFHSNTKLTKFVMEEGVTYLGWAALFGCSSLTDVSIPSTITGGNIATWAFGACTSLESIELPSNLTNLKKRTFSGCTSLKSIELPETVTTLGDRVFIGCTALESVKLSNITKIDVQTFNNCPKLQSITIPETVTSIGSLAFRLNESLKTVYIDSATIAAGLTGNAVYGNMIKWAETIAIRADIENVPSYVTSNYKTVGSVTVDGVEYTTYSK